jgi:hypothetical protein
MRMALVRSRPMVWILALDVCIAFTIGIETFCASTCSPTFSCMSDTRFRFKWSTELFGVFQYFDNLPVIFRGTIATQQVHQYRGPTASYVVSGNPGAISE